MLLGQGPFAILCWMARLVWFICLALAAGSSQARTVYKVVQPDGTILFTDSPPAGEDAEQVDVGPINTAPPLASPTDAFDDTPAVEQEQGYTEFRIASPADNATIRDNAGNVNVDLKIHPGLRSGHKIELRLDGQSIGGGRQTAITLTEMDRGAHSLQAVVKNSSGQVVARTDAITFTLQRRSAILQPAGPRPAPSAGGG